MSNATGLLIAKEKIEKDICDLKYKKFLGPNEVPAELLLMVIKTL